MWWWVAALVIAVIWLARKIISNMPAPSQAKTAPSSALAHSSHRLATIDPRYVHVHEPGFVPHEHEPIGIGKCQITTAIQYVDIAGHESMRTIDIHDVTRSPSGWVYLESYCHQAKAARTFRADHVKAFIDSDGVVIAPRTFISEQLKVPLLKTETRVRAR